MLIVQRTYGKEPNQQRSRVLTAQRTKSTILCITMKTTTKHSWSPQDLVIHLHARRSCASTSWIGQRVCIPVDCAGLDMHFLPLSGFPFHTLICLCQPLFVFGTSASSSALYSATTPSSAPAPASLRTSFCYSAISLSSWRSSIFIITS